MTRNACISSLLAAAMVLGSAAAAVAETTVEVRGLHNCCGACLKGINQAVTTAGAQAKIDTGDDVVTITAPDAATAQKAVDNLAAAGYHGTSNSSDITMKDNSGAPEGKVSRLELHGAHNCCRGCSNAISGACKEVAGVTGATVTAKKKSFVVEGDFSARDLIKALNDAGFHVTVSK